MFHMRTGSFRKRITSPAFVFPAFPNSAKDWTEQEFKNPDETYCPYRFL
jgi:hypothetical protein